MSELFELVRPEVARLTPYNAGLTIADVKARYNPGEIAKLGSNENPLGPSPRVEALPASLGDLFRLYPDPSGRELVRAIASTLDVAPGRIVLGNGSEDLIAVICRTVLRPGDSVVTLYPSFPLHEDYATLMGARVERIDVRKDFSVDVDALVDALARRPRLAMFSNPMNPVGSWLGPDDMGRVVAALSPQTLLVVDEAYAEYAAGADYIAVTALLEGSSRHWIALRTFSKAYGLAGLRLGFGIVGDAALASYLDRARTPFNTNAVAQAAGVAALGDTDHLTRTVALAAGERERVARCLASMGLPSAPSKANFLFFDTGRGSAIVAEALLKHGVIVKPWKQPGYESFVRVSIGAPRENDQFMQVLPAVLA